MQNQMYENKKVFMKIKKFFGPDVSVN